MTERWFEDVTVGESIDLLTVAPDTRQLFMFSAATYNAHRIHYDHRWATEVEGYGDVLVHGPLQSALMARALTDWAGPRGRLAALSVSHRASAHPGEALSFRGTVTAKRKSGNIGTIELAVEETNACSAVLMPGRAEIVLPVRDTSAGQQGELSLSF